MAVQARSVHTEYGVKVGTTVVPAKSQYDAQCLLRTLKNCSPVLVHRHVKTVEHFWEEVQS